MASSCKSSERSGFTMMELLIVLGVLAVLVTATVLLLNPTEFTAQGRDSRRISDLKNLDTAISLAKNSLYENLTDNTASGIVYVSLPDKNGFLDDDCRASGEYPNLPILSVGWQYRCRASADNLRKVDGNGWVPIDFTSITTNPLTVLPIDPVNNESDYYTYSWDGSSKSTIWAPLESQKYLASYANNAQGDGGNDDLAYETRPIAWTTTDTLPPIEISGCATLDQPGETYLLTADIIDSSTSVCINIAADNVTFDCQGHTVDGDDVAGYGIQLYRAVNTTTNVTIQNCTVSDWRTTNIYIGRSNGNTINNVTSLSSFPYSPGTYGYGIYLGSDSNVLTNVTTNSNDADGIYGWASDFNNFTGVTANFNGDNGIRILSGSSNTLTNITANSNGSGVWDGVWIESSNSNIISNVSATLNGGSGVGIYRSIQNTIKDSILTDNGNFDFYITIDSTYWPSNPGYHCNNTVTNITGTGNKPVSFFNTTTTLSNRNNIDSAIILCDADNSTVDTVTLDHTGLTQNNGLLVWVTDNSTFNNIVLKNLRSGIIMGTSSSNNLTNISSTLNAMHGIYLSGSSTLNTFTNVTSSFNNNYAGFTIWSNSNTFDGVTANSNNEGIHLGGASNVIKNSHIEGNSVNGIYLYGSGNTIYNNVFNNNTNFSFTPTIPANNWNTTLVPGTNIISGPNIGGNYWTNSSGTGFSDTCADADSNGICDSGYTLATGNVDNYPLKPVILGGHWDKVDEAVADDLSTYVYTSSATMQKDTYALEDTAQTGTIDDVNIYSRTQGCANFGVIVDGVEYYDEYSSLCSGGTWGSASGWTVSTYDVPGGLTWAKINSMQVILGLQQDGVYNGRATQVWVRVTYHDPSYTYFDLDLRPNGIGTYTNISSQFPP